MVANPTTPRLPAQPPPEPSGPRGRPFALDALFRRQTTLKGVGPKLEKALEKLTRGDRIIDLLFHKPVDLIHRVHVHSIAEAQPGHTIIITLHTARHTPNVRPNLPYRIRMTDGMAQMDLVFFQVRGDYLEHQYKIDAPVTITGKLEVFNGFPQIVHPDLLTSPDVDLIEPVYPLSAGITNKALRKVMTQALLHIPDLPEWQDTAYLKRAGTSAFQAALRSIHAPTNRDDLSPLARANLRLAYDELLASQLALALIRQHQRVKRGRVFMTPPALREKFLKALPFVLTDAQKQAVAEIDGDMASPERMLRLLQGDVGSGKTVVAALALLNAVACGCQGAIMAPTEILARQHAQTLTPWFERMELRVVVLTGRDKGKAREEILAQIADGSAHIVIGTHALFQDSIEFADLGAVVIDEQHRFGVHQRLMLARKGSLVDTLVMTATPIPRTLAMTVYGDMDVSRLQQKPPGRKPVETRLIAKDHLEDLILGMSRQIKSGARIYWVCPLVEESELIDLQAAEERFTDLQERLTHKIGLIHGRLKPAEKDAVMEKFRTGEISVLVATTVIEVGVNVPEATIMVIEHAERFGLSQLHQLRGRVGRGRDQSYCFLLYDAPLGKTAKERLQTMRETEDGFLIAEKDLQLRGIGDILGTRQSGLPDFKFADISVHADLLSVARDDAKLILHTDSDLKSPRGQALRHLLYLFEKDQAVSYLRSG